MELIQSVFDLFIGIALISQVPIFTAIFIITGTAAYEQKEKEPYGAISFLLVATSLLVHSLATPKTCTEIS